jgi:hypothetical protein
MTMTTYMHEGKQYIVVALTHDDAKASLAALVLP